MNRPSRSPHVAILGLGLVGGSLGLALRRSGGAVVGYDRDRATRAGALRRGAVGRITATLGEAVTRARLIVLCVPVQAVPEALFGVARYAPADAVVTDTASVKVAVLRAVHGILPARRRFVGGHPMAGSERSGIAAASAGLFTGRTVVLTPERGTAAGAVAAVTRLWRRCGARVIRMAPVRHDALAAAISHVPHALAVSLAVGSLRDPAAGRMAAGGFLDATRVAAASPRLWEGIFRANAASLIAALRDRARVERALVGAIRSRDPRRLRAMLAAAAARRRGLAARR